MRPLPHFFVALLLLCCSEEKAPPAIPPLARLELVSPGVTSGTAPCVARGDDARQSITVEVAVRNFTLRPPGGCTVHECGSVQLSFKDGGDDPTLVVQSSAETTSVSTLNLRDGVVDLEVKLLSDSGETFRARKEEGEEKGRKARCDDCERSFNLQPFCGDEPEPDAVDDDPTMPLPVDAAAPVDAGAAGLGSDAGRGLDGGMTDAGVDAGSSSVLDASATRDASASDGGTAPVEAGASTPDDEPPVPDSGSAEPVPEPPVPDAGGEADAAAGG